VEKFPADDQGEDNLKALLDQTADEATSAISDQLGEDIPRATRRHVAADTKSDGAFRPLITVLMILVGVGLMGFAVYGALILRGDAQQQREGAETIGKLMLYLAGPIGAVLLLFGVVMLVQALSKSSED
jgi:hypothetical protein